MIKKTIFLWSIVILTPLLMQGQNTKTKTKRGFVKFGTGLYLDISELSDYKTYKDPLSGLSPTAVVPGKTLWIEGGYKLNNGLILSAGAMWELTHRKRIDVVYQGQKELYFEENYSVNVGYEINLGKRNYFTPSLGLLYNRLTTSTAEYELPFNHNNTLYITNPVISNTVDTELGLVLSLDYYHQFNNNLFIGARTGVYYVLGFEGITLTPVFGVKF